MTIIAAVKTSTDLILAADSKVTTKGLGGKDSSGELRWLDQTYDYGTKIAHDTNRRWVVAVAGEASFGNTQVLDLVKQYVSPNFSTRQEQEKALNKFVAELNEERSLALRSINIPEKYWPLLSTELVICSSDPEGRGVRAWYVLYYSTDPYTKEILLEPSVYFVGSNEYALTLLYGHNFKATKEIAAALQVPEDTFTKHYFENFLSPIYKINFRAMPIQDAMDFAAFLVKVQIYMERFLPGAPKCGGPIDIAVVHGLPRYTVSWYPGKEIRHPGSTL